MHYPETAAPSWGRHHAQSWGGLFQDGTDWWDWNGPLTKNIVDIIRSFVFNLTGREAIPIYALIIAQISVGIAGLDLLYPSH